ncbi:pentatricopeptide repeat-containing protein At1g11290, chloroplastic-like isoform X1 [Selaginella moellendorffii]|uniref:pentatricopeptide repeat-containing protein At1g11290, chloroplastic-like isoform X1 n=2 Tax=Selaginella moellendorffii TaxID=88036 RepID=UPI000D1D08A2|nr:pentatricopeptide repeat-containing protein At1g11290, chloroplastic-like isoform X1 [Selaginella moellendorffii]|eukprot:XP_024527765.1 pentatricopeptide repeat-containing protein At1g11290, chloroplastic-like isoform X1 [Selaginella moellendorffii]
MSRHYQIETHILANLSEEGRTGSLVSQLRACGSSRDLQRGKRLHAAAVRCGREDSDIYVASSLLNMYFRCGSVRDAEVVFQGIACQNVVTWTTLVYGYSENGQGSLALQCFYRLQEEGCKPNARTFVAGIKACSSVAKQEELEGDGQKELPRKEAALKAGIAVHLRAGKAGMDTGIFVSNALVDMYSNCGSMLLAREVFEKIKLPDAVSWTSLIMGYAENGEEKVALEMFERMQRRESYCAPSARTFVAALKACSGLVAEDGQRLAALEKGMVLHSQAASFGFDLDVFVANTLVDLYGKLGTMVDARKVFDRMVRHTVVSWTALILGYVENNEAEAALDLFPCMIASNSRPDARSFVAAVKACTGVAAKEDGSRVDHGKQLLKVAALEMGMFLHSEAMRHGLGSALVLGNALIHMYVECGSLVDAHKVFERMRLRDLASWTELILGYAESDGGELALSLFEQLVDRNGCASLDGPVFVAALQACLSLSEKEAGTAMDGKLLKAKALERGMAIHTLATKAGLKPHDLAFVTNCLVDLYAKCGSMADASSAFLSIDSSSRGVVAWTVLIQGHAAAGDGVLALEMLQRMKATGIALDVKALAAGLKACEAMADVSAAKLLHWEICRLGMESDPVLGTCLVSCYAKCGSPADAQQAFDALPSRGVVTWNALLAGYSHQGMTSRALGLLEAMREEGVRRDAVSYLSVLTACSHAGLVDECREKFEEMRREERVEARIEHYHCMADSLGRAGEIDEAVAMVRGMPHEANEVTWRSVLGACARSKNVEVAKVTFELSDRAKDDASGAGYMLMANTVQS